MRIRAICAVAVIALTACTSRTIETRTRDLSGDADIKRIDTGLLQGLGDSRHHHVHSDLLGRGFHLYVRLPEEYVDQPGIRYPVIYLLDGGNTFPLLSAHHHYLRLGDETPPAIIVGIGYGAETYRKGNMRSTDLTAPSEERDFWGGAETFQQVMTLELMPLIETNYRVDADRRILFGQSLGGQFVLFNALTRPGLFLGHIASNPALHRNLPFFQQWQGESPKPVSATRLFVSAGSLEHEQFSVPLSEWIAAWTSREDLPWTLEVRILDGQTHFSATPLAFRQGLDWIIQPGSQEIASPGQ